jgi:outer membrane lipoprotein-sorting protein
MKLNIAFTLIVACLLASGYASAKEIENGESLVRAMHAKYEKTWYDTVTFTQKSTTYNPDGTRKVETWYEAASLPGKLRIDFGQVSEGNGALLVDGNVTLFEKGNQTTSQPYVNMLLVLGFDVYKQSPEATLTVLKAQGVDLSKMHEEDWQGEPTYVVGADKGDFKTKQFWVEKKRLLFVRIMEPTRQDPTKMADTRFGDYLPGKKAWIAARVEVYREEKLVFTEDYSELQFDVKLDPAIFDPKQFTTAHWEK